MKQSQNKNEDNKEEEFVELEKPAKKKQEVKPLSTEFPEEPIPRFRFVPKDSPTVGSPLKLRDVFTIGGTLKSDATVGTVTGAAGETTLNSFQFFINEWYVGATIKVHAAGIYTTDDASANVAIKLKIGSTTYHTITTSAGTTTNAPWCIDWTFIVSAIGTSGTAESYASAKTNNVNQDSGSTGTQTIDTTAQQLLAVTATWASGSSGDSIKIRQFIVSAIR